jgi:hypothetical protein
VRLVASSRSGGGKRERMWARLGAPHGEEGGGGPGSDFAIRGGPDASRAQMWRRLLGGMTGEVLGGGHMWEGKGHVGHGRRAWAGGLGPVRRNNILFDLFKNFSNRIESIQSKNSLPLHKKFKIKYGFEGN